ncbi:MAG TPA: hypothetical protein VG675_19250 [Bryobacteraceae bacterium]|nr:hypothetical protein [Bryobacteraceae bacterium]
MRPDLYTKLILTTIALLLGVIAWQGPVYTVQAQNSEPRMQFDPDLQGITVPGGAASLVGRIGIDVRTGDVYGFPTAGKPYPQNMQSQALAVSKPIHLGRFDLSHLPR